MKMSDKNTQNKKQRNKKRFIYAHPIKDGWNDEGKLHIEMTYVLDTGNLISDVQKQLQTKTICVHNYNYEYADRIYERCIRARQKLKHDLEFQIRATGANNRNAEICAKQLMEKMRY